MSPLANYKGTQPAPTKVADIVATAPVSKSFIDFVNANRAGIAAVSKKYGIHPLLLFGLSAYESEYGTSHMYKNRNNPFGATPHGDRTGGLKYPSITAAWESWGDDWGERVRGVGTNTTLFTSFLTQDTRVPILSGGPAGKGALDRGPYNTLDTKTKGDPKWKENVAARIDSFSEKLVRMSHLPEN
jgi:hypothetical protein